MKELTWNEYYEDFYCWSESTQIRYLSRLNSYGDPDYQKPKPKLGFCATRAS